MKLSTLQSQRKKEALTNGPPPPNPFKEIRTKLQLSHQALADRIGVSKLSLIRLEQGTFTDPLPAVLEYCVTTLGYSELRLTEAYSEFQFKQRQRHLKLFGGTLVSPNLVMQGPPVGKHPLRELRDRVNFSVVEVSKALCIPQSTLQSWESHPKRQKSVPRQFQDALYEIGYNHEQIDLFCKWYDKYRSALING